MTYVGLALLVAGSAFSLLAAIGLLRFPDFYTRLHVGAKAGPLGAGLILLSVAATSADGVLAIRCVVGFVFLIMVGPISTHLLARAMLRGGSSPGNITSITNIDNSR
jgi:multicomponent Na+:H+ antiporter subunit G